MKNVNLLASRLSALQSEYGLQKWISNKKKEDRAMGKTPARRPKGRLRAQRGQDLFVGKRLQEQGRSLRLVSK